MNSFKALRLFVVFIVFNSYGQQIHSTSSIDSPESKIHTEIGEVVDGKQNGLWCLYQNHKLILEQHYVHGLADGLWTWYYPNGNIETTAHYQRGYKKGQQTSYFENGKTSSEGPYEGEDKDGIWCDYTMEDNSYIESTYKKGQLNGTYKIYDDKGNLREEGYYHQNIKSSVWNYDDGTSKPIDSKTY